LQYASYKFKNGWQNYNLATVTQLFEEKLKMENLNKDNIRFTYSADDSTQIDADYFDFLDYSSNDESSEVLETNVNDDPTMFKNPSKTSRSSIPSYPSIVSSQEPNNASNFSTTCSSTYSSTQDLSGPGYLNTIYAVNDHSGHGRPINTTQELLDSLYTTSTIEPPTGPIYSSKYGSNIIAAFLESDWPSDDEDETPFSFSIKERGQALYEEKRRQAEDNFRGTCDPGSVTLAQVRKALPTNENSMTESSKNAGRRTAKNTGKGKKISTKMTKTAKKSRKQIISSNIISTVTTSSGPVSNTVPGLQVISPRTTIPGLSLDGLGKQQVEEKERSQTPIRGTKRKVREDEDASENLISGDFDVDKMFDDFDPAAHAINVTPGTMYNQLLADISPSIRNRFAANSPGQEFDYLWATYAAPANKRARKSPKGKERVIDVRPKIVEVRDNAGARPSSYQASLDAWAASDAVSGEVSQTPTVVEVPRTPPHQIRSASGVRTPGSAFSLSEFLNLSPSPM
jgi:hypothetical protein